VAFSVGGVSGVIGSGNEISIRDGTGNSVN
jgi:hypothetical protein